jgi:dihydroorotate dehydrogenase (NAD+) catalytic subunit
MTAQVNLNTVISPGLKLANPIIAASGTFGYGEEFEGLIDIQELGAIICKGTTLLPRNGNPQPRIVEVCGGVLNSVGLQNIGVEAVVKEKAPVWAKWKVPVIVNIAGDTVDEYEKIAEILEGVPGVKGIEVNISCPNVKRGGMQFGTDPVVAAEVTQAVRSVSSLPLIVKLSPNVTDIVKIARAVEDAGADSISLINTLNGMSIDIRAGKPRLGAITGGLSGPAVKPVALLMVYRVAGSVTIPVIGCGGIMNCEDVIEFILAGATAVQVGTANLINPHSIIDIIGDLRSYMISEGIEDLSELRGKARN